MEQSNSRHTPELDIVIPVYNEGENISKVLDSLIDGVKARFRVLICYDFEEDNTLEALRNYPRSGELSVELVKNAGTGPHAAVMSGLNAAVSDAVLVMPADDDYNSDIIDRMVDGFHEGNDIVVASRFVSGGCMVGCPPLKAFLVRATAVTLRYLARIPAHDPTNGFRLFSRRLLESVKIESEMGWTFSMELLVKCHRLGWGIVEIPAKWFERSAGASRFKVMKWAPAYLRWYFYAFGTTYLGRGPETVTTIDAPPMNSAMPGRGTE